MSESSLRHIRDGKRLIGIIWREWAPISETWVWMAETPMGRLRDFPTEGTAEAWLRIRARAERRAA